jgi:hypothetical protein
MGHRLTLILRLLGGIILKEIAKAHVDDGPQLTYAHQRVA